MNLHTVFKIKPFVCPGCQEPSSTLICGDCHPFLRKNHRLLHPQDEGLRGIYPIFHSFSSAHRILTHWKDHGGKDLERILFAPSPLLREKLEEARFDCIVPIPQHADRSLKRGHASALRVAEFFSKELRVPILNCLELSNHSAVKQANLSAWERIYSENPFRMKTEQTESAGKNYQHILIVDDLITTGSTIEKAASLLEDSFSKASIYAAALGWKPKKG